MPSFSVWFYWYCEAAVHPTLLLMYLDSFVNGTLPVGLPKTPITLTAQTAKSQTVYRITLLEKFRREEVSLAALVAWYFDPD